MSSHPKAPSHLTAHASDLPRRALVVCDIPDFGYRVSQCLAAAGVVNHVMGTHRWSLCRVSTGCRRYVTTERAPFLALATESARQIAAYCRRHRLEAAVPADRESSMLLATHRSCFEGIGLFPLSAPEVIERLHNKWTFWNLLESVGVEQPRTALLEKPEDLDAVRLPYPLVVKPLTLASSRGVWVAQREADLREYLAAGPAGERLPRLVQEFVPGEDGDLTMLAHRGSVVAWTLQKRKLQEGTVTFFNDEVPARMAERALRAVNYSGVADFDVRQDSRTGRWVMIECNPRFPGSILYKLWGGVNFAALGLRLLTDGGRALPFSPIEGDCVGCGLAPRAWLRALLRGHPTPQGMNGKTRAAWRSTLRDPVPWLIQRLERRPAAAFDRPVQGGFHDAKIG